MTHEDALIKQWIQGDTAALDGLIEQLYPEILRYCLWHTPNRSLAEEDAQGNTVKLTGLAALRYEKAQQAGIEGEVTPEKLRKAVEDYQACLREYGVENSYELPDGVYGERITPFAPLLKGVKDGKNSRRANQA